MKTKTPTAKVVSTSALPRRLRLFYGIGEFGQQFSLCALNYFLLYFFTDVLGISAAAAGVLMLVAKYHESNCKDKEVLVAIDRAIKSSIELRSKKELIEGFIATVNTQTDVNSDWRRFVSEQKETDISSLIKDEKLNEEETRKYIENACRDGEIKTTGTDINKLMPPVSRFGGGNRTAKKQGIIEKLQTFFEKYFGIV